jgi:hypothetical protein
MRSQIPAPSEGLVCNPSYHRYTDNSRISKSRLSNNMPPGCPGCPPSMSEQLVQTELLFSLKPVWTPLSSVMNTTVQSGSQTRTFFTRIYLLAHLTKSGIQKILHPLAVYHHCLSSGSYRFFPGSWKHSSNWWPCLQTTPPLEYIPPLPPE